MYDLDLLTGWLLYGYAYYNEPVNKFGGIRLVKSPMSNEADILHQQLKEMVSKSI